MQLFTGEGECHESPCSRSRDRVGSPRARRSRQPPRRRPTPRSPQSYAANHVSSVLATTQRVSCYAPEVTYFDFLDRRLPGRRHDSVPRRNDRRADAGLRDPGRREPTDARQGSQRIRHPRRSREPAARDRAEQMVRQRRGLQPPARLLRVLGRRQDLPRAGPRARVRGLDGQHRSRRRVRPAGELLLARARRTSSITRTAAAHKYDNGSNQINPLLPAEAIALSVHPAAAQARQTARNWITTHNGAARHRLAVEERKHRRARQAVDRDRHEPREPVLRTRLRDVGRTTSSIRRIPSSTAQARPDGTHSNWSPARELPTINGNRFNSTCSRMSRPTAPSTHPSRTTSSSSSTRTTTSTSTRRATAARPGRGRH